LTRAPPAKEQSSAVTIEPRLPASSRLDRVLVPLRIAHVLFRRDVRAWRHLVPWLSSLRPGVDPLSLGIPWLAFGAIEWLEQNVRSRWRVLELGSGGSTLFFRRRVRELVSVEHDARWFERVQAAVPPGPGLTHLLEPEHRFTEIVCSYPERHFDLVLVDGGSDRAKAAIAAAERIAPLGGVMVDNSDVTPGLEALDVHRRLDFSGIAPWNLHGGRIHLQTTSLWLPEVAA
jgi:hypothetical protein